MSGYDTLGRRFANRIDISQIDTYEQYQDELQAYINYDEWSVVDAPSRFRSLANNVFDSPAMIKKFRREGEEQKWDRLKQQSGYEENELRTIQITEAQLENQRNEEPDTTGEKWTSTQEDYLAKTYGYLKTRRISEKLGKSPQAIYSKASREGLEARSRNERNWSSAEENFLKEHYNQDMTPKEVADELDRNVTQVYGKAYRMREKGEL